MNLKRLGVFSQFLFLFLLASPMMPKNSAHATTRADDKKLDILPFEATEKTLNNGLKVIVVPTGFPNIVSLQIPVQTGSRNEVEPGKSGFAHFFEHMMFRGTPDYPPERFNAILTRAGARNNAYTSNDYTNYHTTFAREDLEEILKIEADRFQKLAYGEEAFKTEARAVLGEYNKNSANPILKLLEVQRENAFTTHTYRHTTMGFLQDIEDMPDQFDYSRVFFDRWYRPEYTTLIVAGDVTPEEVIPLVEKYWGDWKPGTYRVDIPREPKPQGPIYAHVDWTSETLPFVTVAFHGPGFLETPRDHAAVDTLFDLYFGRTSDLYKKLVEQEQKVDELIPYSPLSLDPFLVTVIARLKEIEDAVYVRDEILKTAAEARVQALSEERLADAKSNARYSFARTLDNTESIASSLARFVHIERSYNTLNELFRIYDALTPADLQEAARRYFTDSRLVVTTLFHESMPEGVSKLPNLDRLTDELRAPAAEDLDLVALDSPLPQLNMKLLFRVGSAHDPRGKEGLATLAASMVADAGSRTMRLDEITRALFPMAGSFTARVDKEMTTFTGIIHRDNWRRFTEIVLPMLLDPGLRPEDFERVKARQLNALRQDLKSDNEEELGKERLQSVIFAGTAYEHPVLGTEAGIESITLDDVRKFIESQYKGASLTVGLAGDAPQELLDHLQRELARLPAGPRTPEPSGVIGRRPSGIEVEIIQKETRATAISFGHPIDVARNHPDFAALWVARSWLGEHRSMLSHLFQRIREVRGLNYGTYAYIEAFPRGMFQFFPDPNIARRAQIFEVWIRPVLPENAHMALRIAIHELEKLIENGLTEEQFQSTRDYLLKNVFLMTANQNQQLGYALDSRWYGIGEFTSEMRERLAKLTREDVNRAVRKHLSAADLWVAIVTRDAEQLKERLVGDAFSPVQYDAPKPEELLEEDRLIGAKKLNIAPDRVRIIPVAEVFAR